jgi:hypothetical protein
VTRRWASSDSLVLVKTKVPLSGGLAKLGTGARMAFAHLARKLAVDSLTPGLESRPARRFPMDGPVDLTRHAGKDPSGAGTGDDPGVSVGGRDRYGPGACSGTRAICVD